MEILCHIRDFIFSHGMFFIVRCLGFFAIVSFVVSRIMKWRGTS